jgi:4-amino-4-deoxy-L-arabinose transferase-like glycosyltransferase
MLLAAAFRVLGDHVWVARLLMVGLGVLAVALTVLVAQRLAGPRVAQIAGYVAALYPPAVMLSGQSYAQHLAAVTMLAVTYFGLRAVEERRLAFFALAGLAFGVGCLTRPSLASVAPFLAIACIMQLRRTGASAAPVLAGVALFVGVTLVCVVPVQAHNAGLGAGWTLSTNNERNFFLGNNPYTPNYKTSHLGQRSLDELDPDTRSYLSSFYERQNARKAMQAEALGYITRHPLVTAYRTLNRATAFWGFDYLASRIIQEHFEWGKKGLLPLLALEAGSYCAVMVLAIVALFGFRKGRSTSIPSLSSVPPGKTDSERPSVPPLAFDPFWALWLVLLAVAYELPYMAAFSGGTYHFPVIGLLIPLAAVPLAAGGPRVWLAQLKGRPWAWVAIAALGLVQAQYAYYPVVMSCGGGRGPSEGWVASAGGAWAPLDQWRCMVKGAPGAGFRSA